MKPPKRANMTAILAVFGLCAGTSSGFAGLAPITLATDGVGYITPTIIPPSGLDLSYLNNMINVYDGRATSPMDGETYTVDKGSSTPASPNLPVSTSLDSEITPSDADGKGQPTATVHLGGGTGFLYLIAQW